MRVWLILTILLLAITAYFVFDRTSQALNDRWLIAHGTPVDANFDSVDGDPHPHVKKRPRDHAMPAVISYDINGQHVAQEILLEPKNAIAEVGTPLPIRVDPKDPKRWTEATEPVPWTHELAAVFLLLPLCAIVILAVIWKRQGVLNIWRNGDLGRAVVVEVRHNAGAPNSRLVRCHLIGEDRRVFSILVPARLAPAKGDTIDLLTLPGRPSASVLAQLYGPA